MPSDLKPRPGRNRSKSHAYRGAHSKIISADTGNRGQTPSSGHGNNMAGASLFGFWTAISQCLQNLWARRHIGLLLLLLWILVILCYLVNPEPTQMLRLFGCVMISMVILGFLPVYCCSLCRRRKKMNRILKVLKKQKAKLKKEPKGRMVSEERALISG
uniref:FMR1 neighbor n=1 Tax=Rattus norvegicus TaxID=10116 RepID=A0A8I6A5X6_RAT